MGDAGSAQLPFRTPWGWNGSQSYRSVVSAVDEGGTIRGLNGVIPSRAQGVQLIEDAGGSVLRIEGPHAYPNPHDFTHINDLTNGGQRGTIEIAGLE
jgi:hypothetical protein